MFHTGSGAPRPAPAATVRQHVHVVRSEARARAAQVGLDAARLRDVFGAEPVRPLVQAAGVIKQVVHERLARVALVRPAQRAACMSTGSAMVAHLAHMFY